MGRSLKGGAPSGRGRPTPGHPRGCLPSGAKKGSSPASGLDTGRGGEPARQSGGAGGGLATAGVAAVWLPPDAEGFGWGAGWLGAVPRGWRRGLDRPGGLQPFGLRRKRGGVLRVLEMGCGGVGFGGCWPRGFFFCGRVLLAPPEGAPVSRPGGNAGGFWGAGEGVGVGHIWVGGGGGGRPLTAGWVCVKKLCRLVR